MAKTLYIGAVPRGKILSGGEVLDQRNLAVLRQIVGEDNVDVVELQGVQSYLHILWHYLCLNPSNYSTKNRLNVEAVLNSGNYSHVFLATSLCGKMAKMAKIKFPHLNVIAHYHNIERYLAKSLLTKSKDGLKYLPLFVMAWYNERLMAKYADTNIVLNEREAALFEKYYGKKPEAVLPISIKDDFDEQKSALAGADARILFVGSSFLPNVMGIKWFLKEVMPHINVPLHIVGKGMEAYKDAFSSSSVTVLGSVEDIASCYYDANCVISPIFVGGGMKTKTAEALMYGKTIVGTKEAFEGYAINEKVGLECNTAEEFIDAINRVATSGQPKMNVDSRRLFLEKYSVASTVEAMKKLLHNKY